ncbi:dTDP-4-dehydrorhamnose reductase [Mastigocoleus sp. MO_188.B34]|uniref:dTDP-4-dehydrorhamnose reductase n=1 Tax=Mastigocoleus sp. MO_188.B34 TaxID=3036635 RepID=UPI00260DA003|nr:dTDP-4-dehydrorhamnose reductase [Mastigocoleus sp. MO_188.B34]MDJ0696536.1 dTDP-4-dehydrorhamnose reductase [Mastigocoleus sp. MO_188.B34]
MNQSILLLGNTGQLGQELQQILTAFECNLHSLGRSQVEFTQPGSLCQAVDEFKPNLIINCAAYTAVDKAESEPEIAEKVNAIAPGILAEKAQQLGAYLIHISTDYVFDGSQGYPYQESDATNPQSVYGQSKLAGEEAIRNVCDRYMILRTAWVHGCYGKGNFVKTMLRLGAQREEIRVVDDQIGSPTWTGDLANAITQIIPLLSPDISGIYHYTNSGVASWYDFAVAIFDEAQHLGFPLQVNRVAPITTAEYPTPAKRPSYSVLSSTKLSKLLGSDTPHWRVSLSKMLSQWMKLSN